MTTMINSLRGAFTLLLIFTVLLGGVYPLLLTAISQLFFNHKASGSLILSGDTVQGSHLLGQRFTSPRYFWGRPSAHANDPMVTGGSNFGPANPDLADAMNQHIANLQKADPRNKERIPIELITASASGLDPHISMEAAKYQLPRVARLRNLKPKDIESLIALHSEGTLGKSYINVLRLNLALDELGKKKKGE